MSEPGSTHFTVTCPVFNEGSTSSKFSDSVMCGRSISSKGHHRLAIAAFVGAAALTAIFILGVLAMNGYNIPGFSGAVITLGAQGSRLVALAIVVIAAIAVYRGCVHYNTYHQSRPKQDFLPHQNAPLMNQEDPSISSFLSSNNGHYATVPNASSSSVFFLQEMMQGNPPGVFQMNETHVQHIEQQLLTSPLFQLNAQIIKFLENINPETCERYREVITSMTLTEIENSPSVYFSEQAQANTDSHAAARYLLKQIEKTAARMSTKDIKEVQEKIIKPFQKYCQEMGLNIEHQGCTIELI